MEQREKMFEAFHQFRKLDITTMFPELSRGDFHTLMSIEHKRKENQGNGVRVSELAEKMHVAPPAVSRTLKGLEDRELIERVVDQKDRRNTYVCLTKKGALQLKEAQETMNDFSKAVFDQLDGDEMERLANFLGEIYEVAQKELKKRAVPKAKKNQKES